MTDEKENPPLAGKTRGLFFAVGRPQWETVCEIGMNPAVAFLIMARGTGRDNATTSWSAESIFNHSGITWRRAKAAVDALCEHKLIERTVGGKRPRYKLTKPEDPEQLIWLPNEIVTGAGKEIPPVARIRQTQEVEVLQLFVEFYAVHELIGDGGIPRNILFQHYTREKIVEYGPYIVFGFNSPETRSCNFNWPLARFKGRKKEGEGAWDRIITLEKLGLIEWVHYLAESEAPEAELIHALSGDEHAVRVFDAANAAVEELPGGFKYEAQNFDYVIPVLRHLEKAAVVGVARLRYRPKTGRTAAWYGQHVERCRRFDEMYSNIARGEFKKAASA